MPSLFQSDFGTWSRCVLLARCLYKLHWNIWTLRYEKVVPQVLEHFVLCRNLSIWCRTGDAFNFCCRLNFRIKLPIARTYVNLRNIMVLAEFKDVIQSPGCSKKRASLNHNNRVPQQGKKLHRQ